MRGVIAAEVAHEAERFAETVAAAVGRHPTPDPWRPGAAVSDSVRELELVLIDAGWDDLGGDSALLPYVAPAAAALGRGFASLRPVDRLLGGALRCGRLARYAGAGGERLVEPRAGRLQLAEAGRVDPLPYADSLGVAEVGEAEPRGSLEGDEAERRMAAWVAASTGYLAGVCEEALRLAIDHTRSRIAFGRPLSALEPVQQTLADAATTVEGLRLTASGVPGPDELLHAGAAAVRAVAGCQQVTGALGFTLEFPMQRAQRRVRASRAWSEAVLESWEAA
jgi:hypothetical protein